MNLRERLRGEMEENLGQGEKIKIVGDFFPFLASK